MQTLYPAYMSDAWKAYEQMSSEDKEAIEPSLASVDPFVCDSGVLPFLAWEAGVDVSRMDVDISRAVISAAFASLLHRGTIGSLEKSIEPMGEIEIMEWFNTAKTPYTFDAKMTLAVDLRLVYDAQRFESIKKQINESKNVRSKFENLLVEIPGSRGDLYANTALNHRSESKSSSRGFRDADGQIHAQTAGVHMFDSDSKTEITNNSAGQINTIGGITWLI